MSDDSAARYFAMDRAEIAEREYALYRWDIRNNVHGIHS